MKKIILFMIAFLAVGMAAFQLYNTVQNPCNEPLAYSLGTVDSHFGMSEIEIRQKLAQAESVWEKALGKELFNYRPEAQLKINFIYDERQQTTFLKQRTEVGLDTAETLFMKVDRDFNILKSAYDSASAVYEKRIAQFEAQKVAYDAEVSSWNAKGGAPEKKYAELEAERQALNTLALSLNSEASQLNTMAQEVNATLAARNKAANDYNRIVAIYNDKYGHGVEFNQAEFAGDSINVYQFTNTTDLILALSHEFGHALGMGHVDNARSIMYYLTNEDEKHSLTPTAEDVRELKRVCKIES